MFGRNNFRAITSFVIFSVMVNTQGRKLKNPSVIISETVRIIVKCWLIVNSNHECGVGVIG